MRSSFPERLILLRGIISLIDLVLVLYAREFNMPNSLVLWKEIKIFLQNMHYLKQNDQ